MALKDSIEVAAVWTPATVRLDNLSGVPVNSAEAGNVGELISDEYTLTVSARSAGTGTITISGASTNNPWLGRVITDLAFDSDTVHTNILPGVNIKLDSSATNGETALIIIGAPHGTYDATGGGGGVPTDGVRHRVENDADSPVSNARAILLTQAVLVKKVGELFAYVKPFADGATEKTAGGGSARVMPYHMNAESTSGVDEDKTITLKLHGTYPQPGDIINLTTGETQGGTNIKADGTPYKFISGDLTGVEFAIHNDVTDASTANILIFPSRFVQIAPDEDGDEGTYGITPVTLTEEGESAGVIGPGGFAYYWTRFVVTNTANNESNPYPASVSLQSSQSAGAGWGE